MARITVDKGYVRVAKQAGGGAIFYATRHKFLSMLLDEIHFHGLISLGSSLKHVIKKIDNVGKRVTSRTAAACIELRTVTKIYKLPLRPPETYRKIPLSEARTSTRGRPSSSSGIKS